MRYSLPVVLVMVMAVQLAEQASACFDYTSESSGMGHIGISLRGNRPGETGYTRANGTYFQPAALADIQEFRIGLYQSTAGDAKLRDTGAVVDLKWQDVSRYDLVTGCAMPWGDNRGLAFTYVLETNDSLDDTFNIYQGTHHYRVTNMDRIHWFYASCGQKWQPWLYIGGSLGFQYNSERLLRMNDHYYELIPYSALSALAFHEGEWSGGAWRLGLGVLLQDFQNFRPGMSAEIGWGRHNTALAVELYNVFGRYFAWGEAVTLKKYFNRVRINIGVEHRIRISKDADILLRAGEYLHNESRTTLQFGGGIRFGRITLSASWFKAYASLIAVYGLNIGVSIKL